MMTCRFRSVSGSRGTTQALFEQNIFDLRVLGSFLFGIYLERGMDVLLKSSAWCDFCHQLCTLGSAGQNRSMQTTCSSGFSRRCCATSACMKPSKMTHGNNGGTAAVILRSRNGTRSADS